MGRASPHQEARPIVRAKTRAKAQAKARAKAHYHRKVSVEDERRVH